MSYSTKLEHLERIVSNLKDDLALPWNTYPCILWNYAIDGKGYGIFKEGNKLVKAHRKAYILTKGEIPAGLLCCHFCNVRNCFRPSHLYLGTNDDNMRDCSLQDRHWDTKISSVQVIEMREKYSLK